MKPYRLLVCGSREGMTRSDAEAHRCHCLFTREVGAAAGQLTVQVFIEVRHPRIICLTARLWYTYAYDLGRNARNLAMLLLQPDEVAALPGGTGTADMVRQARGAGIPITYIKGN